MTRRPFDVLYAEWEAEQPPDPDEWPAGVDDGEAWAEMLAEDEAREEGTW